MPAVKVRLGNGKSIARYGIFTLTPSDDTLASGIPPVLPPTQSVGIGQVIFWPNSVRFGLGFNPASNKPDALTDPADRVHAANRTILFFIVFK